MSRAGGEAQTVASYGGDLLEIAEIWETPPKVAAGLVSPRGGRAHLLAGNRVLRLHGGKASPCGAAASAWPGGRGGVGFSTNCIGTPQGRRGRPIQAHTGQQQGHRSAAGRATGNPSTTIQAPFWRPKRGHFVTRSGPMGRKPSSYGGLQGIEHPPLRHIGRWEGPPGGGKGGGVARQAG